MSKFNIRDRCSVNANKDEDTFVGIKCEDGNIRVHFPLGFDMSQDDKELRKEILLLINTIASTTKRMDSELQESVKNYNQTSFPIQAYIAVIYDFYARGYYKERESVYTVAKRGKIHWSRTIKTQQTYMQDGSAFYLDFVTKKNAVNENELITLIHEYCVYESFSKIGWLFTKNMPAKPKLKLVRKLFKAVLNEKIANTFNDRNKRLFRDMLAIINYEGEKKSHKSYRYGTYRFEYVWESLIDRVYGVDNKEIYFPLTFWDVDGQKTRNTCLEPDTIMVWNGNVYVLDAKYYKYGETRRNTDLPKSTSINKQITYGEYIAKEQKFKRMYGDDLIVYNCFLMPFNALNELWQCGENLLRIGQAVSNWKTNEKTYEKIQGILVDVKHLMKNSVRQNEDEIMKLAECIEKFVTIE